MSITEEEFYSKMSDVTNALRTAKMMLMTVSQEDIRRLRDNLQRADGMAMFIVPPIQYEKSIRNLDEQRQVLDWVQDTKLLLETCPKT